MNLVFSGSEDRHKDRKEGDKTFDKGASQAPFKGPIMGEKKSVNDGNKEEKVVEMNFGEGSRRTRLVSDFGLNKETVSKLSNSEVSKKLNTYK
jgi:hypothetical protein